jgi:hypothetical protein
MKPFNLDEALAGKPVITRNGKPFTMAGYNEKARDGQNIAGWVDGTLMCWHHDGSYSTQFYDTHEYDLFMASTERKEWIVRSTFNGITWYSQAFLTYESAKAYADSTYFNIPTIHEITIHE